MLSAISAVAVVIFVASVPLLVIKEKVRPMRLYDFLEFLSGSMFTGSLAILLALSLIRDIVSRFI